jgi:hypothetical protein
VCVAVAVVADALGVVVGVVVGVVLAADALVPAVVEGVALTVATFEVVAVEVTPLCCRANAPPVMTNRSMLSAPVTRRAPWAGWARRRRGVVRG